MKAKDVQIRTYPDLPVLIAQCDAVPVLIAQVKQLSEELGRPANFHEWDQVRKVRPVHENVDIHVGFWHSVVEFFK